MKMDIEGYEHHVFPHLVTSGAICHVNKVGEETGALFAIYNIEFTDFTCTVIMFHVVWLAGQIMAEFHWSMGRIYKEVWDWPASNLIAAFQYIAKASKDCMTDIVENDDESYAESDFSLPQ